MTDLKAAAQLVVQRWRNPSLENALLFDDAVTGLEEALKDTVGPYRMGAERVAAAFRAQYRIDRDDPKLDGVMGADWTRIETYITSALNAALDESGGQH